MKATINCLALTLLACGFATAEEPAGGLTREQALKLCRTLGGAESGKFWFEHGDKEGPYHHAGRLILSQGGRASYAVAEPDGQLSEVGLVVPDDAAELHMDFFTGKSGHGWVTTHYFTPEVKPASSEKKDDRSDRQKALGPAAEFAIAEGNLPLLKVLVEQGLKLNEYLNFEERTTALSAAVWGRKLEIAKYLLKKGADKDKRGRFGDRPIALAVEWKLKDFCELLAKPDGDDKKVAGVPEGVLEDLFAERDPGKILFLRWKGGDPPEEVLKWLQKTLPGARPASQLEVLERRPLGAASWYRDKASGDFGSLLELSMEPSENGWKVRIRDSTGPFLAGGGSEQLYTRHHGYWLGKVLTSWEE